MFKHNTKKNKLNFWFDNLINLLIIEGIKNEIV